MNLTPRQKAGFALILAALIAAVGIQLSTGNLFHVTATEEQSIATPIIPTRVILQTVSVTWSYAAPLLACGLAGLCLLLKRDDSIAVPPK